jgi:hypothetical protein
VTKRIAWRRARAVGGVARGGGEDGADLLDDAARIVEAVELRPREARRIGGVVDVGVREVGHHAGDVEAEAAGAAGDRAGVGDRDAEAAHAGVDLQVHPVPVPVPGAPPGRRQPTRRG